MADIIKGKNPRKPYTVRYRDTAGKQREASFTTRKEADAFANDQERAKRYGADVNLKAGKGLFTDAVETWINTAPWRNERTKETYVSTLRKWVKPAYEGKSVRDAATTPDIARALINVTMAHLCGAMRARARTLIVNTLDMLVADGTIESHRVAGIKLTEKTVTEEDSEDGGFVFITDDQAELLAYGGKIGGTTYKGVGIVAWLQRTMGLRICEALGVEKSDFFMKNGKAILRLKWQASRDGKSRVPLKKRKAGQFRDVPVPEFVWNMVKGMADGPLCPGTTTKYLKYATAHEPELGQVSAQVGLGHAPMTQEG